MFSAWLQVGILTIAVSLVSVLVIRAVLDQIGREISSELFEP